MNDITSALLPQNLDLIRRRSLLPSDEVNVDSQLLESILWHGDNVCFPGHPTYSTYPQRPELLEEKEALPKVERAQFIHTLGFDDGLLLEELLANMPRSSHLLIYEPSPEWFFILASRRNLSAILGDERVSIIIGREYKEDRIQMITNQLGNHQTCIHLPRKRYLFSRTEDLDFYKGLMTKMIDSLKGRQRVKTTAELSFQNFLINSPRALLASDNKHLKERIKGKPFVAVGLGPSLAFQTDLLRSIQDKVIIGVCDNALKEVLDAGIDPDLVFHVEWRSESLGFYQDLHFRKPAILCAQQSVHPKVLDAWPYDLVVYPTPVQETVFSDLTQEGQWPLIIGTTVGDFAIQFGVCAEASEVYLVGMDFSMPTGSYHHPNTSAMREFYGEAHRFWTPETWDWRHVYHEPQREEVEDFSGEIIFSHASTKNSVKVIARLNRMKKDHQQIFTTSLYGARIDAQLRSLEVLSENPAIDKELKPSQHLVQRADVIRVLSERRAQMKRYYRRADNLCQAGREFLDANDKGPTSQLPHFKNRYQEALRELQKDAAVAWVEKLVMLLDQDISMLATKNKKRFKDDLSDDEMLVERAGIFVDYIERMKGFKDLLTSHLDNVEKAFLK